MISSDNNSLSVLIREKAVDLGFDLCGIAPARILTEHEARIKNWCSEGMNCDMEYLCRNRDKRINPGLLVPDVKSVIVTGINYYTNRKQGGEGVPIISRYAYGVNYHDVIISKLNELMAFIKSSYPDAGGRSFVDSAPILEKAWAREAGLGWPGRHSVLINSKIGSFFFIGVILINLELEYDKPLAQDNCSNCRLCIDSCPTGAINDNRTINAGKCIAYQTIESKSPIYEGLASRMGGRIFGCDRCQEVCPWNRNAEPNRNTEFEIPSEVKNMTPEDWRNLSQEQFKLLFKRSAISRRKFEVFKKNISIVMNQSDFNLPCQG